MTEVTLTLAQLNPIVGDFNGNLDKMLAAAKKAEADSSQCIVFPELFITGYPPEDLLFRNDFIEKAQRTLEEYAKQTPNITSIVGAPYYLEGKPYNTAIICQNGKITEHYNKQTLPNHGVFDEKRYFNNGNSNLIINIASTKFLILICEDFWTESVLSSLNKETFDAIITLNASPFEMNKQNERMDHAQSLVKRFNKPLFYVNQLGGQDELVFDGHSFALSLTSEPLALPAFAEAVESFTLSRESLTPLFTPTPALSSLANIYQALVLATRDYIQKNHFKGVVIGLSGGIDSALTLAIAVDAVGADNVHAVMMPSEFTAQMSLEDAKAMANSLNVHYEIISIENLYPGFITALAPLFKGRAPDTTEQNLQARCRGMLLMAISNKLGHLVLTTGNRSEMAVGYATLYGDMAGGYAVLKDILKTTVFKLADYRNQQSPIILQRIIDRPPSAELAADQIDEDNLPPYEVLDSIIRLYIDEELPFNNICQHGFDEATVREVIYKINLNEYKRRQSPIGIRINHKAFGKDRRYPITHRYQE